MIKLKKSRQEEQKEKEQPKTTTSTTTKAGNNKPAFGVSGSSMLGKAKSFEEYSALRKQQEQEDGMRSAADRLASQYGYKKVGNQVVFATPNSPLPKPTAQNTATRAQAPGAYGITPKDYVADMTAIDRYVNYRYDDETQEFLDKYFNGQLPNEGMFESVFKQYAKGGVETEPDVMNFHRGAELVRKATEAKEEARAGYEEAIGRLGEDAVKYLNANESDYYERFGNAYGAADALEQPAPLEVKGFGGSDQLTLADAKKYENDERVNRGGAYDLQRWSQTTQEERNAYKLMQTMYGYKAAEDYLKSLEPELNKRLAEAEVKSAEDFAAKHPIISNAKAILNAPVRGIGALQIGAESLFGKEADLYDPRLNISREAEAIREQTASGMGGVGRFVYNTGMSIADNLANMMTWGALGKFATTLSMGGSSAASAFTSAVERGANEKQALTAAVISGVAEGLFEKLSLDNVIEMSQGNQLGSHVLNVLKQMGIEGSEELATGIANEIADRAIMGDLSNYELLVDHYVKQGLMEDLARRKAEWSSAGEIGLGVLGGVASGGVMGTGAEIIGSYRNRNIKKELDEAARNLAKMAEEEASAKETPATTAPVPQTRDRAEDARAQLEEEYLAEETKAEARQSDTERSEMREERENEREYMPAHAQEGQQQGEQPEAGQQQDAEEKPVETASEGEKEHMFNTPRLATVRTEEGDGGSVNVIGVTMDDEMPIMITQNDKGETDYWIADELDIDDETNELLSYEGVQRMDGRALRNYLEGYDSSKGSVEEYANAYSSVFQRAKSGVDYEQAALQNDARSHLSEAAMLDAYTAGMNAYNQTHETVQPAAVETVQSETAAAGTVMSAKETGKGGTISKQYNAKKFSSMSKKQRNNAIAQMELLKAIASRTGRKIVIVDSITDSKGNHANASYNAKTGEIRVALDADEGAYAYAAMHELTHAMKKEHNSEWQGFVDYVRGALEGSGQKWDELVKYQMDRFGYNRTVAEEEVICNTVPAILKDERNVLKLYKGNRKLFDRVVDWVRGLLKDIKTAGDTLSKRSESWKQMDALAADRKTMQEIYDRMMAVMEKPGKKTKTASEIRMSIADSFEAEYDAWAKEKKLNQTITVGTTSQVLVGLGAKEQKVIMRSEDILHALRHDGMTDAIMKQIPEMMENPIIVMKSSQLGDKNNHQASRVVMYGSVNDANGAPVIAVLELRERQKGGQILDMQLVKNAYGKDNRLDVQIQKSEILYLDPNKKRTNEWLHSLRLQLPSDTTNYGSIGSISYPDGFVKMEGKKYSELVEETGIKYSYMGESAKTANIHLLNEAKERLEDGENADQIRKDTGWFKGMDGKWRFETDDSKSKVNVSEDNYRELGEVLEHKELYEAYPDLEDISVVFQKLDGPRAQYNRVFDSIDVDYSLKKKPEELRQVLMHEIQHAIQAREDFTRGASKQYWEKRIFIGFDARRTKDKEIVRKATEKLRKIKEENPDFYFDMMKLREMKPDMPRAEIDWETLEPKGEDPIEWQRYDARRDELEQKYGNVKVFDFITIESVKERGAKSRARSADDLYLDTAGEIEARDVTDRADLTKEERRERAPYLGNEDTVFSDEPIYFSMRDSDENVQDALSAEQKAFALVKGHRITAAEADKIAGKVLQKANSDYDSQKLAAEISRIYDYIERGEDVDWNQVDDEMTRLMAKVMEKSRTLDLEHENEMQELRYYLKNTKIALNDGQAKEAANKVGSYGGYRKLLFGRVNLSRTGTSLDQLWSELHELNRELFPADAREGDQPILLLEAVDAMKPKYHTGMGMNVEESASWLAGQMNEAYFSLPAVKAAANNGKTFGESVAALKDAMKRFEETSWTEYQSALRSIREARGEQKRTQKQEETAALRKKYVNWRERDTAARKERELKTKYRAKIERTAQTLTNWMLKPTDAKHVPEGVEDSMRRMLESLDFSGKSTKTARQLSDQLDSLANALLNAQEGEDENRTIFLERDQQMIDEIRRVAELIRGNTDHQQAEGRGVYDLNGMELRELSKWLDVVKHVITEASKLRGSNLPGESVEQVATMSMMEMSRKKAWKDKKWITQKWMENFGPDMQDSFTFFERMGPTANAIFRELRDGFDKVTQLTRQAEAHTKTILEGVKLSELTGSKAKKQTFELESGKLEMTKAQIMELYVLNRREQAQGHIYGQGIRIQGDQDARPHTLSKKEVTMITDTLTADEKRVAEGLQRFLSRECASWGNETSLKLLGYRKFGEEYYWPIRTDSNTRNTTKLEDNYAANISAIKNQGMTKATIEGAKNAIVVGDIFDTYTKHISNMAAYAGYALPLSDFTRWYNSRGVKTEIEQMMGAKGLKYINNFLMAVNGSALREEQSGIERAAGWMSRNAKIASVGANLRVVIQQPTSYARAAMYMSSKYLTGALAMKAPQKGLVEQYCGIAQWKRWGFYETNIGPNLRQMIVGDDTLANKAREIAMKPASLGDDWTLNHLWNACELETREMMPELKQGSREYYEAVGKRMSEIIDRTQVVDSVFHRSQMMRSKSGMAQMLTNFMSEPTKTYNMLMSAISDYADNRKNKAARNRVARAFTVYAVSGLLTAAAAALIDAFRDEDAEKEWLEKYLDAAAGNAVDNLNPLGLLPGVKDIMSLVQGYEPSRMDTQSIQKLIWAAQEIQKYTEGNSKMNLYGVSYKTAQALSSLFGIPVSNVMRDINSVIQTATGQSITKTPEARKSSTLTLLYRAISEGKKARAKELREDLRIKAGMTPKEIDTALAKMLENDPKVAEAYAAKEAKDYAKMNRAINALTSKGFGKEVVEKAITNMKPKETKAKDPGEQLAVTLYSEADVVSAMKILAGVEKGGSVTEADVRAMISERVAGSEAKDPEKSVKSGIQTEMKKEYLAAEAKGNTNAMNRIGSVMKNVLGTTQDDLNGWVKTQHADNLRAAIDARNSAAAQKAVEVMRRDGKTDSDIKSSLSKYKQLYIDAVNRKDMATANRIKSLLMGLGLKGKRGGALYTEQTFEDWLKK